MILRFFSSPSRQPWLYTAGLLVMIMSLSGYGDLILAVADAAEADSTTQPPSATPQAIGGATPGAPSVLHFNETRAVGCDARENTPGYITTILLFNSPFVFGCLSRDSSSYYFSVALSGLNFPNTPIWLANRHYPVQHNASFILNPQGSALLEDFDGRQVWSSNTDGFNPSGIRLTTEGNLILFDSENRSIWESFSEPIDLLVPGQFLNPGSIIVAGFSSHVSPTGSFIAEMRGGGLIFYENSTSQPLPYYALGYPVVPTTPDGINSSPCNHTRLVLSKYNLTQVQSADSPSCQLAAAPSQLAVSFDSPIVFIRLEPNGVLKGYYPDHKPSYDVFQNSTKGSCGFPNACGPYGICENSNCTCPGNGTTDTQYFYPSRAKEFLLTQTSCVRKVPLSCLPNSDSHFFLDVERVDYFANDYMKPSMLANSFAACKSVCLGSCSCQAAFYRTKSKECYLHESVLSMIRVNDSAYVGAIKMQQERPASNKSELGLIVGISITTLVSTAFLGVWYYHRKKNKGKRKALNRDDDDLLASLPGQPKRLNYKELQAATWEFSQKLGVGGFGSVYKGMFSDGSFVAVKQLENTTRFTQGLKEFRNEVNALSNINHQNLVHLRGFCADGGHRLLVYEYVSNGSLDTWLFRKGAARPGPPLDWKTRLAIAVQTARGLVFLHEQCRNCIVHLDIKPQNILLDEKFVPKLSDFGLSRLINEDQDSAVSRMRGTPGYMAPECLVLTDATEKSDVYSFGMVLLELVSGRKNVDVSRLTVHGDGEGWYFPALAAKKLKEGNVLDIIDKSILPLGKEDMVEATRVIRIAFWCIQDNPSLRPTMGNALLMLEGYSKVSQPPLAFHFGMRFHLSNSITSASCTPKARNDVSKQKHSANGDHPAEPLNDTKTKDSEEQGESMDINSSAQSLYNSPLSSRQTSPCASPIPQLLSYNSFSHSPYRHPSPRHSPSLDSLSPAISQKASPNHLQPISSPNVASPMASFPLPQSRQTSPLPSQRPDTHHG
ncbi:hypothetical protein GOP47_0029637 [Adiantum capillus-veneris]|nr:hypothetical protein GOP47_0029637 [Adiantum capillus-veneris]